MALIYNEALFQEFRAKAITKVEDLVIGETYCGNCERPFILKEIISDKELWTRRSRLDLISNKSDDPAWIIGDDGFMISLHDHNIGASYNPWLIFSDKEISDQCREELTVDFQADSWYDDYFDREYV